jgi:uncharacterized YigZ family protein
LSYVIPGGTHRVEQVVDRSRFITTIGHSPSVDDARVFIDSVRAEFADATHNCWAFVAGPPGSTAHIGMSDAGEPHGTAGRPMLDVLLHSDVGEVVAVVTRYYGGVKLGKGGLVRAYGGAVQRALESMPRAERVERVPLRITIDYGDIDAVRRLLTDHAAEVVTEEYGERVIYRVAARRSDAHAFEAALLDQTAGRAVLTPEEG